MNIEVDFNNSINKQKMNKLNALVLGYALAIVSSLGMLVLGILANLGLYTSAAVQMGEWHIFFSLSIGGIIAGMIEAAIMSFIFGYLFGLIYNRFVGNSNNK